VIIKTPEYTGTQGTSKRQHLKQPYLQKISTAVIDKGLFVIAYLIGRGGWYERGILKKRVIQV